MAGNPISGGAQVIAQQSSGRKTALALVLAIAAAELVLSGRMQTVWHALWGPAKPLSPGTSAPGGVQLGPPPGNPSNNSGTVPVGPGIL